MGSILVIGFMVVAAIVVVAVVVPMVTGSATFKQCKPDEGDIVRGVEPLLGCPDPDNVCSQYKTQMDAQLEEIHDGFLLESNREHECVELYCPLYETYFKCKCEQCKATGGFGDNDCVNECAWSSEQICQNLVNCPVLID